MEKVFHILKLSSIYTAAVIFLLHTFIPHSHNLESFEDPEISCEKNDRCLMEFLGVILEHDFGIDHLEHFQIQDNHQIDFEIDCFFKGADLVVLDLFSDAEEWNLSDQIYQNKSVDIGQERGPPSYS
ncbi:MAG: hypothetical protein HKN68_16130 [Saprospiraceae bacterium]|nr:hypothetical protein [Saprospiraceae bacterium]